MFLEIPMCQQRSTPILISDAFSRGHVAVTLARRARCPAHVGSIVDECCLVRMSMPDVFRGASCPAHVGPIFNEYDLVRFSWNCPDVRHPLCHTLNNITTIFQASIEPMIMSVSVESEHRLSGAALFRPSSFPSVAWLANV